MRHRLAIVRAFREGLAASSMELAQRHATDRPLSEVLSAEVLPLLDACRFLERSASRLLRTRELGWWGRPLWLAGTRASVLREPWGVVLVIAPSNYPLLLPGVQTLQALVAGNSVLLKPGRGGSPAAKDMAAFLARAGLPADLLHVLDESAETSQAAILERPDKIFFTGAAETGVRVLSQVAKNAVPVTLELSGCDAAYVRDDADLDMAARAIAFGLRLNSGRTCIAPKRVYVSRSMSTEFEGRFSVHLATSPAVPLAQDVAGSLEPFLRTAQAQGAHLFAGKIDGPHLSGPVVVGGLQPDSPLLHESFFAPVLGLVTVSDDDEAIRHINKNPYGLGASIFSRDLLRAGELARDLEVGTVLINDMIAPTADPRLPFGGCKMSGYGVTRGAEGLLEMTRPKSVITRVNGSHPHFAPPQMNDHSLFSRYIQFAHGASGWKARFHAFRQLLQCLKSRGK